MEEIQALTEYLRLMISFDPKPLPGMEPPEARLQNAFNVLAHIRVRSMEADPGIVA